MQESWQLAKTIKQWQDVPPEEMSLGQWWRGRREGLPVGTKPDPLKSKHQYVANDGRLLDIPEVPEGLPRVPRIFINGPIGKNIGADVVVSFLHREKKEGKRFHLRDYDGDWKAAYEAARRHLEEREKALGLVAPSRSKGRQPSVPIPKLTAALEKKERKC